jgi:hypothetical protein
MRRMRPPAVPDKPADVLTEEQLRRLATCAGKDFESRRDTALILLLGSGGGGGSGFCRSGKSQRSRATGTCGCASAPTRSGCGSGYAGGSAPLASRRSCCGGEGAGCPAAAPAPVAGTPSTRTPELAIDERAGRWQWCRRAGLCDLIQDPGCPPCMFWVGATQPCA